MPKEKKEQTLKVVEAITHLKDKRKNLPSAELQPIMQRKELRPVKVAYPRGGPGLEAEKEERNMDLDPQLVWRGKDQQDWSDLVVNAPPLYIQEKVHPKALIDDLRRHSPQTKSQDDQPDLFGDFNGIPEGADKYDFYQHEGKWQNRMILGDSLQVMASLAEREGLRGQVQCIYFDPPYGIKFNSNFQWSTTSRDVKDGKLDHITREPEMVKAFRDTWRDGIHSYLGYLRDRLMVARDLLQESGSIFLQINDANLDLAKSLMAEVFGSANFVSLIFIAKTSGYGDTKTLSSVGDFILWFAKNIDHVKYRQLYLGKNEDSSLAKDYKYNYDFLTGSGTVTPTANEFVKLATYSSTTSQGQTESGSFSVTHRGTTFLCPPGQHWKTTELGFSRLIRASRIFQRTNSLRYVRLLDDYRISPITNL
jgi:adenine-specific DNA-methyltransferase